MEISISQTYLNIWQAITFERKIALSLPAYRFDQTSKKKKEQFIDKLTQLGVIGNNEGSGDGDEPKEE